MSNPFSDDPKATIPASVVIAFLGFISLVVLGVIGLVALDKDVSTVLYFIGGLVPVMVTMVKLCANQEKIDAKTDAQSETLEVIKKSVNGKLDAKFDDMHNAIVANGNNPESEPTNAP
jgi:hypothetical protein